MTSDERGDPVGVWEAWLRSHRRLTADLDASLRAEVGLTLDEYDVLHQTAAVPDGLTMGELAERVLVARSSLTRLVDRLVTRELIARTHDARDRRRVWVRLTPSGQRLHRRAAARHGRDLRLLVGEPLGDDGLGQMAGLLARLDGETG